MEPLNPPQDTTIAPSRYTLMRCAPLLERLGAPFFGCLLLAAITHLTGLDQTFSQLFYDPDAGLFPMRHSFLMETVMHEWARYLTFGFALLVLAAIPVMPGKSPRRAALFTFLSMVFTSTLIALIKRQSDVTCPWDLTQFGGDGAGGQCWPSGHASVGFSLLAVYFAAEWLGYSWARLACWLAALFGILLTLSQTARGAHFLTHGLWTGLLIWLANVALATLFLPRTRP